MIAPGRHPRRKICGVPVGHLTRSDVVDDGGIVRSGADALRVHLWCVFTKLAKDGLQRTFVSQILRSEIPEKRDFGVSHANGRAVPLFRRREHGVASVRSYRRWSRNG